MSKTVIKPKFRTAISVGVMGFILTTPFSFVWAEGPLPETGEQAIPTLGDEGLFQVVDEIRGLHFEAKQAERQAKESVITTFFPVLDSLEVSMRGEAWERADEIWKSGIISIYKQFISALHENSVEEVGEVGEEFDPHIHTSISTRPTKNADEDNRVAEVVQKGYRFAHGEVIRSPKVIVFDKAS